MDLDRDAVDHVARLARLDLSDPERERMRTELAAILEHAGRVRSLDLSGVGPTAHAVPLRNVARPDEVVGSLTREEALSNAPAVEDDRFKVPRIIEDAS